MRLLVLICDYCGREAYRRPPGSLEKEVPSGWETVEGAFAPYTQYRLADQHVCPRCSMDRKALEGKQS